MPTPAVITLGAFPVCATPITDASLVGPGTAYPLGFTQAQLYDLLNNYNWKSIQTSSDAKFSLKTEWLAGNQGHEPYPVPQTASLSASFGSENNSTPGARVSYTCGYLQVADVAQGGLSETSLEADCSGNDCNLRVYGDAGINLNIDTADFRLHSCYLFEKLYYLPLEVTAAFTVALGSLANSYGIIIIDSTKTQSQLTAQVQDSGQQMGSHHNDNVDPEQPYYKNPTDSDYEIVTIGLTVAGVSGVIYGYTGWNTLGNGASIGDPSLGTPYTATASASVSVSQITINPLS